MGLQEDFETAAEEATTVLPDNVSNEDRLELYGLFKQAKVGDNTTSKPGIFDPKGRAKWDAWEAKKGTSPDDAKKLYIELVAALKVKYNVAATAAA